MAPPKISPNCYGKIGGKQAYDLDETLPVALPLSFANPNPAVAWRDGTALRRQTVAFLKDGLDLPYALLAAKHTMPGVNMTAEEQRTFAAMAAANGADGLYCKK